MNWFYLSSIFLISAHPDITLCMSTRWYSGVASPAMAYVVEGLSPVHVDLVSASPEVTVSHDVEVEVLETVPVETVLIDDRIEISEVGFEEGLLPPSAHPEGKLFVSPAILLRCFFLFLWPDILSLSCLYRTYCSGGEAAVDCSHEPTSHHRLGCLAFGLVPA